MKNCLSKRYYFHNKTAKLKIIILLVLLLLCLLKLSAQKESNIKLKIETGVLWDWVEGRIYLSGPFLYVEPKLRTSKNTIVGLRIGASLNTQAIKYSDPLQFYIDNNYTFGNAAISLVPTFDYYLIKNKFRPYYGLGLGYHFLTTHKNIFATGTSTELLEVSVSNQVGLLLRGGFDLHKFIVGLEFNYIPKADIETSNGQFIGTILYSNISLSIGYTFGNGKS